MKVLEPGDANPQWHQTVKCSFCRAKLEININDVRWQGRYMSRYQHDVDGDLVGEDFLVQCPCCKTSIKVSIPSDIQRKIRPMDL